MVIRVESQDLDELRRDLRTIEDIDQKREMLAAFRDVAGIVTDEAKMRANSFSFRLADTLRPGSGMTRHGPTAYIRGGRAAYPWYGWADFGSRRPRTGQSRSVGPWTGSGRGPREGRFIYPAIEAKQAAVVREIERGVERALRRYEF